MEIDRIVVVYCSRQLYFWCCVYFCNSTQRRLAAYCNVGIKKRPSMFFGTLTQRIRAVQRSSSEEVAANGKLANDHSSKPHLASVILNSQFLQNKAQWIFIFFEKKLPPKFRLINWICNIQNQIQMVLLVQSIHFLFCFVLSL